MTPHFALDEFAVSAAHPELAVPVPLVCQGAMRKVAEALEVVRVALDRPMRVLSGYRSPALNNAVGGSPTSQHTQGEAADWTCDDLRDAVGVVIDLVRDGALPTLGQIIYYPAQNFMHFGLSSPRFKVPTVCVHWPAKGYNYHPITPTREAMAKLLESAE